MPNKHYQTALWPTLVPAVKPTLPSHCPRWFMRPWTRVIPWAVLVDGPVLNVQLLSRATDAADSIQLIMPPLIGGGIKR